MTYSNRDLIVLLVDGFCDLFKQECRPVINISFDWESNSLAEIRGSGAECLINFSCNFSDNEVCSVEDAFFALMVAAHELSHWVGRHNEQIYDGPGESEAMECWADVFGQHIIFAVVVPGSRLFTIIHSLMKPLGVDEFVQFFLGIGAAINRLYLEYCKAGINPNYPSPGYRAFVLRGTTILAYAKMVPGFNKDHAVLANILLSHTKEREPYPVEDKGPEEDERISNLLFKIQARLLTPDSLIRIGLSAKGARNLTPKYYTAAELAQEPPANPYEGLTEDEGLEKYLELYGIKKN